jgi:hypothetical protein
MECCGDAVAECVGECTEVVEDLVEDVADRGVVEVVEKIVKHHNKIFRLLRALKKLCCETTPKTTSDSE